MTSHCIAGGDRETSIRLSDTGWENVDKTVLSEPLSKEVSDAAVRRFEALVEKPSFQSLVDRTDNDLRDIPSLRHSQVQIGKLLGQGAMSSVYEVNFAEDDMITGSEEEPSDKQSVVKIIKKRVFDAKPSSLSTYLLDMAKEGEYLSRLNHPNIIEIRGYSRGGLSNYSTGRNDGFFIILDKLKSTLAERIGDWKLQKPQPLHRTFLGRGKVSSDGLDHFLKRLCVAIRVSDALAYMHGHRLIHRDIKPYNVGFDLNDEVKLFDMDTCRVLPSDDDDTFRLTKRVGTLGYMSPECYLGKEYNANTDCYSFAFLLHEILSMEAPSQGISRDEFPEKVFKEGVRPDIPNAWPRSIRETLTKSWTRNVSNRMSMEEILETLEKAARKIERKCED